MQTGTCPSFALDATAIIAKSFDSHALNASMPSFKDDSILVSLLHQRRSFNADHRSVQIIAPGSQTTLAQLGLPESFTPARHRFRSRMFPAETSGQWEPHKVRKRRKQNGTAPLNGAANGDAGAVPDSEEPIYEEDIHSDEGAVWPIKAGKITNWSCFFALLDYVYFSISPPFHTPILLIAQPVWTPKEHEKITQFVFEKFKCPGFALVDSAVASCYAHGLENACIVDVGADKADVTAIRGFIPSSIGRNVAIPGCGGEAMTQRLHELLGPKGFSRAMCEQLKKSPICEILPPGTPLPGSQPVQNGGSADPAPSAPAGVNGTAAAGLASQAPRAPGLSTETVGVDQNDEVDDEGILDVAGLVAGGKMNEFLARKEKEKQDKLAAKKKGDAAANQPKQIRLKNSEKEKASFFYEDHALFDALKGADMNNAGLAEARAALDEGPDKNAAADPTSPVLRSPTSPRSVGQAPRRELTVGTERFEAATGPFLANLSSAIYRTIQSHPYPNARSELWNNLVIVGNGSGVRGFKEALIATLNARYLISPSSATMFTSELPSNLSTPAATGANTPITMPGGHGSHVNPLLHAATTAAAAGQHLHPPALAHQQSGAPTTTTSHSHSLQPQTPTSIKVAKVPEYFSEWKDVGSEEAAFLGAQVAARVLFVVNAGTGSEKGYMSRTEYNENGPSGIGDYSL